MEKNDIGKIHIKNLDKFGFTEDKIKILIQDETLQDEVKRTFVEDEVKDFVMSTREVSSNLVSETSEFETMKNAIMEVLSNISSEIVTKNNITEELETCTIDELLSESLEKIIREIVKYCHKNKIT